MSFFDENSYTTPREVDLTFVNNVMLQVYIWMTMGLLLTAGISFALIESGIANNLSFGVIIGAIVLELAIVFGISAMINKISSPVAMGLFFLYAALNGVTFSVILMAYTSTSITAAFVSTAALFGAMSIYGATTKADLTKLGTYLFVGLIGVIIAIVVNIFLGSSLLSLIISVAGVIIFTGLTAHDTQKISQMAASVQYSGASDAVRKLAIFGALILYLDFVNLFLFILRLIGGRD